MAFTSEQIARAGHYSLDVNLRTTPTDQVGTDRPLLQALLARRQNLVGGLQYIKEQVLKDYGSNYQRYSGDDQHTYNRRNLLDDVQFSWKEAFDGFTLNRTQLRQNGIVISDDGSTRSAPGADEKMRLHNLLDTNLMALRKGFDQSRDLELHRDGSQGTGNLVGLDGLVKLDPTSGTVGGLDQSTKTYWRNYAKTSISTATQGTLIQEIEKGRRASIKHGGQWDFIICGGAFYDAFRKDAKGDITAYEMVSQ
ncbi:MAG: phage major capsid protein, partial [Nitrococcus sp.]|nr:phage major capsid protein [Nitrococcus sp.]